ncbi:hypothetical protein MCOR12_009299, partial [Pyricularia oryzae]
SLPPLKQADLLTLEDLPGLRKFFSTTLEAAKFPFSPKLKPGSDNLDSPMCTSSDDCTCTRPSPRYDLVVPSLATFALVVITFAIRIYTRACLTRALSMDDYVMAVAVAWTTVFMIAALNNAKWGMGKDIWDVPLEPNIFPAFLLCRLISSVAFCLATGFAKGSILLFYLRIFPTRKMRYIVWILFGFTVGYSVASAIVNVFSCDPVEASWRIEYATTARCINRGHFYYTQAALGILTDIATVVTPLPMLKTLRLPMRQKVGAGLVLTVGAFVCIISIVRFKTLFDLADDDNLTRDTKPALLLCVLELNFSIIGGNFPTLRPFSRNIFPRLRGGSGSACGWWSKYYARSERMSGVMRREARVRGSGAGASLWNLEFGFGNVEAFDNHAIGASSLHGDRAGRDSGEQILMAGREQRQEEHHEEHKEQKQEQQPRDEEAGISGPREQTETRGITKANDLGCKESSKQIQRNFLGIVLMV